jgi:hypothetical protein
VTKPSCQQTLHQTKPVKAKEPYHTEERALQPAITAFTSEKVCPRSCNGLNMILTESTAEEQFTYPPIPVATTKLRSSTKMCFYERIDFLCGDHRWGTMRQQCPREYRTGESCRGVKLSHDDYINKVDKRCQVCEALEIKERKYHKEFSSLMRWREQQRCGVRRGASIEKALETLQELEREIVELNNKRTSVNRRL